MSHRQRHRASPTGRSSRSRRSSSRDAVPADKAPAACPRAGPATTSSGPVECRQLALGVGPDAVFLVEPCAARPRRSAWPGLGRERRAVPGRRLAGVDHVIAVRLRLAGQFAGPGSGRCRSGAAGRSCRVASYWPFCTAVMASVEPSNWTTWTFSPPCSAVKVSAAEPASTPTVQRPPPGPGLLQVVPGVDRAAAGNHQLKLIDVIRPSRQVVACARGRSTRSR